MGALTIIERPLNDIQLGLVRYSVLTKPRHWRENLLASICHTMQGELLIAYPLIFVKPFL
jgi:hypothetical protein